MAAVDGSTDYHSLQALQETLLVLLELELAATPTAQLELHTHDPSFLTNLFDHADHRATGNIVAKIAAKLNASTFYYAGYGIAELPVNLSDTAIKMKILLFNAYDRQPVLVNQAWGAAAEWPTTYAAWLSRTYKRTELRQIQ